MRKAFNNWHSESNDYQESEYGDVGHQLIYNIIRDY